HQTPLRAGFSPDSGRGKRPSRLSIHPFPAAALKIIEMLKENGYEVVPCDPLVEGYGYTSIEEVAGGADCLVVLVEHRAVKEELALKETEIKQAMRQPLIIRFYPETPKNR
ncbi:unnamed protein product, partial [marine sediment metagenome]